MRLPKPSSAVGADDRVQRHARLAGAGADLADELALQRLLVELALAGDDGARGAHAVVEVERVEHERRAGLQRRAVLRPQAAGQAAGAAGHRHAARVLGKRLRELVQPRFEPLDQRLVGALLRAEDLRRVLERRAHVAEHDDLRAGRCRRRPRSPGSLPRRRRWSPSRRRRPGSPPRRPAPRRRSARRSRRWRRSRRRARPRA